MITRILTRRLLGYRPRRVTRPLWLLIALLVAGSCIAVPPAYAAAVPEILYVSGDRIMRYSASTGAISTEKEFPPGVFGGEPHMSLNDAAWVWRQQSLAGESFLDFREELVIGTQNSHPINNDQAYYARVSPGGIRLMYAADAPDPMGGLLTGLLMYDVQQDATFTLSDLGDSGHWSPNGDRFVFVSYPLASLDPQGVMLYTKNLTGLQFKVPTAKLVTPGEVNIYSPRWSPNGSWIAFQRVDFGAGTVDIVLTDPAGISEELLATLPSRPPAVAWDGRPIPAGIACSSNASCRAEVPSTWNPYLVWARPCQ